MYDTRYDPRTDREYLVDDAEQERATQPRTEQAFQCSQCDETLTMDVALNHFAYKHPNIIFRPEQSRTIPDTPYANAVLGYSASQRCNVANPGGLPCSRRKGHEGAHDEKSYGPPHTEQPASAAGSECGFDEAWIGKCKQIGNPRCPKHEGRACTSCGADATRNCPETGQFVCGADLCDECEHAMFPDGTNGGIGFNAQSLPEGMKSHCRKAEQKFQPWYMRGEKQSPAPAAQETGEWRVAHDGPSRPMIETPDGRLLSLSQFQHGRWESYDQEEQDCAQIIRDHNEHQSLSAERERLQAALQRIADYPSGYKFSGPVSDGNPVGRDREQMIHIARAALNGQGKE